MSARLESCCIFTFAKRLAKRRKSYFRAVNHTCSADGVILVAGFQVCLHDIGPLVPGGRSFLVWLMLQLHLLLTVAFIHSPARSL